MSTISKPTASDLALLALVAVIWGTSFVALKISVLEIGALWSAALRVVIAFFVLLPFYVIKKQPFPNGARNLVFVALVSLLNIVIPFIMISWALKHIDSGIAALLLGLSPFMAMLLGHFFTGDERITPLKVLAVCCAFGGISLVVGEEAFFGLGTSSVVAQAAVAASGACYVTAGLLMRKVESKPLPFTLLAVGLAALMLTIFSLVFVGLPSRMPSPNAWIALLWLGVLSTGLAYILRFYLVNRVGISTFSLSMNTVPIFGVIFGAILLNEVIETTTIVALALVVLGLMISRAATPSARKQKAENQL